MQLVFYGRRAFVKRIVLQSREGNGWGMEKVENNNWCLAVKVTDQIGM